LVVEVVLSGVVDNLGAELVKTLSNGFFFHGTDGL